VLRKRASGSNIFIFGTTGELIKIFPLLRKLEELKIPVELWSTAQQIEELPAALSSLHIKSTTEWLCNGVKGKSLHTKRDVVRWFGIISIAFLKRFWRLRSTAKQGAIFVHGDTMTTAIAALFGRVSGGRVVHIEAGMRSGDWRNPFPEELSRRAVAHLSSINYAPGETAVNNLRKARGRTVNTQVNTISDALKIALQVIPDDSGVKVGLVSVHRSELYENDLLFKEFLTELTLHGRENAMVFIDHPVTARRITNLGMDKLFQDTRIKRVPKLQYFEFVKLLANSSYVITDSGGLQQECEITGHPCLVHRAVTESVDLARSNIVLSKLNIETLRLFLENPQRFALEFSGDIPSATELIYTDLLESRVLAHFHHGLN
jgi:UDP-N-acetylglucosamine 2-epimerase (non-hydrolysing)